MAQTIGIFSFVIFFIALSAILKFFPPRKRNHVYGYRTGKSLSSDENWIKSNKMFGDLFFMYSLINSVIVITLFLIVGGNALVVLYTALSYSAVLVLVVLKTNKA